jgi:hypothetical protein
VSDPRDDPQYQEWLARQPAQPEGAPVTEQPAAEAALTDQAPGEDVLAGAPPEFAQGGVITEPAGDSLDPGLLSAGGSFTDQHAPDPAATAPVTSATNETAVLPANAQAAAARAHVGLREIAAEEDTGRIRAMAAAIQADLERFIPSGMIAAAEREALALLGRG